MELATGAEDALRLAEAAIEAGNAEQGAALLIALAGGTMEVDQNRAAALACASLGNLFENQLLSKVAARPWYLRAMRLIETDEPCVEQGWVAVAPLGCDVDDSAVLLRRAELAIDRARQFGDLDLEVKGLADAGLARVQLGDTAEGMAMIDEAMALACGGGRNRDVLGKAICSFYTACYLTVDLTRVEDWTTLFRRQGLVGPTPGSPLFLNSHCDSVRAMLLSRVGRWSEAEELLLESQTSLDAVMPGAAWHPPIALAELRIMQGRFDEAEVLLIGKDDFMQALVPMARLHQHRGDFDLARATAGRGLALMGTDRLRAAALLGIVVEANIGIGDTVAAAAALDDLDDRIASIDQPGLRSEAARLRARVLNAEGEPSHAATALRGALELLGGAELPLTRLSVHLDLARLLEPFDRSSARVDARAAVALLGRLDVIIGASDVGLLQRLGGLTDTNVSHPCRVRSWRRPIGGGPWGAATARCDCATHWDFAMSPSSSRTLAQNAMCSSWSTSSRASPSGATGGRSATQAPHRITTPGARTDNAWPNFAMRSRRPSPQRTTTTRHASKPNSTP